MNKTPRQFRNDLYQYFVDNNVSEDTASRLAQEAELYANAYEAYQLRDITAAAHAMGFMPWGGDDADKGPLPPDNE